MNKRAALFFLVAFAAMLCYAPAASAEETKDVAIFGVGTVSLPADIEATEMVTSTMKGTALLCQKNGVFLGNLVTSSHATNQSFDIYAKNPQVFEAAFAAGFVKAGGKVLQTGPTKVITIAGKRAMQISFKIHSGIVSNTSMYVVEKSDGVQILAFLCADSDYWFWEKINAKILASIN